MYYYIDDAFGFFVSHNKNLFKFDSKHTNAFIGLIIHLHNKKEWLDYLDKLKHYELPNSNMALYDIKIEIEL